MKKIHGYQDLPEELHLSESYKQGFANVKSLLSLERRLL